MPDRESPAATGVISSYDRRVTAPDLEPRQGTVDELFDAWEDAWSGKDQDAFRQICSPQVHYEDPLTASRWRASRRSAPMPSGCGTPSRMRASSSSARVCATGAWRPPPCKLLATHREPVGGLPATNKFIVVPVIFYCELDRGRLLRVRAFFDLYDAAVQLGVLPGRGTLGEKALLMLRGLRAAGGALTRMDIAIPIFDNITALDAVGPYEVLSRCPTRG